jgi:HD-GYP domain-containing protein (c-di-GMP phosphodiesterase class II)
MGMVRALTASIDAKHRYTRGHSERVSLLAGMMATAMGLPEPTIRTYRLSGLLHDVGKIGVPEAILSKPAKLTDEEFEFIKRHPVIGHEILRGIPGLEDALPGVLHHHEQFGGRGYPEGLAGESIPLLGRVLALCDTFDAMSSSRSYRAAMSRETVLAEITKCAGRQFDPQLAELFVKLDFSPFDALFAQHGDESATLAA